ncbi:MAG: DUF72 domain-containing protein, partial [Deltaproteobacteria bacterium]|nr:DUF72 domain-containing protein [Deltaproteobacteria bacterium]
TYSKYLGEDDTLILKVPQVIFAQKLWRGGSFVDNELYLNPEVFTRQFFEPAVEILGSHVQSFIFEQEYQRKKDRLDVHTLSEQLDKFFRRIPADDRYHIELRTESYLASPVFRLLEKYGIGQVFSHWTWLPPLRAQFARAGRKFTSAAAQCIVRLMTPRGIRYDEAYARAHPFNRLVEEMLDQRMIDDTVALMVTAIKKGVRINVIINNRAGGNAPLIARQLAARFMEKVAGNREGGWQPSWLIMLFAEQPFMPSTVALEARLRPGLRCLFRHPAKYIAVLTVAVNRLPIRASLPLPITSSPTQGKDLLGYGCGHDARFGLRPRNTVFTVAVNRLPIRAS